MLLVVPFNVLYGAAMVRHYVLGFAILLPACGLSYSLTPNGVPTTPKPAGCSFVVTGTTPAGGYEEIAVLEGDQFGATNSAQDFKEAVADQVCSVGGDVVVTEINGLGTYMRGLVLRKTNSATPAESPPAAQDAAQKPTSSQ